jgi:vitellogenic carboxypeptidase-like protein
MLPLTSDFPTTNIEFKFDFKVEYYLKYDWMRSISHAMPTLLENYKVLIYNGNLDLILGAPLTEKYIRTIPWNGRAEYLTSKKKIWTVPDPQTGAPTLAGYVKSVKNFRQVVVYKAGHMVPTDRPQQAADMITRFIDGKPF